MYGSATVTMRIALPIVAVSCSLLIAVACGSSDENVALAGAAGMGGDGGAGGSSETGGAAPASGGSFNHGGDAVAGANAGTGGEAGSSATSGAGGQSGADSSAAGASGSGGAANGGAGTDPEVPPTVVTLGCFAASGDGWDFVDGVPAGVVNDAPTCGGRYVSNHPEGLAPQQTPTSFSLTRKFVIADDILTAAKLTLSFGADDAASFVLNGHLLGACTAPNDSIGFCSQSCRTLEFPAEYLLGGGAVNELEIEVINLLSVELGNGNWGWTGIFYSVCAAAE